MYCVNGFRRYFRKYVLFVKGAQIMYKEFEQLLQNRGLSSYKVAKDTGVSQTALSNWRSGKSLPTTKTLQKLADYFGVTIDYLTGTEPQEEYYLNRKTAAIAQDIFDNRELRLLYDAARDAQPEDIQTAYDMLLALKRKERGQIG